MYDLIARAYYENDGSSPEIIVATLCAFTRVSQGVYRIDVPDGRGADRVGFKPSIDGVLGGELPEPLVFSVEWLSETEYEFRAVRRSSGAPRDPYQMWITVERVPRTGSVL